MSGELPRDLDAEANKIAMIRAAAGALEDRGVGGLLFMPEGLENLQDVLVEAAGSPPPETVEFLEGEATRLMVENGLRKVDAFVEIAGALGFVLGEKLAELSRTEASIDAGPGKGE